MSGFTNIGPLGTLRWVMMGGGHDGDPAQDRSGNMRPVPMDMSPDGYGGPDEFAFAPRAVGATNFAQQSFGGVADPGTPMLYLSPMGSPNAGVIIGQLNSLFTGQGEGGGNSLLGNNPHFQKLKNTKLNINAPPRIQEATDADGVRIRKIQETGDQHHLGLLEGLPLNGALFEMTGYRQPELPKIPTALQTNDGMMMQEQLQQMVGQIMSLGQMFAGLAGNRGAGGGGGGFPNGFSSGNPTGAVYTYDANTVTSSVTFNEENNYPYSSAEYYSANNRLIEIQNRVPSDMSLAIGNLARIVQGLEVNDGVSFFTGGVVHQDTYLQHAENLLCECKTLDDLMNVLSRLQFDEELFGRDKLEDVYVTIDTSYGPTDSVISWSGNVYVQYSNTVLEQMNAFSNIASSNTESPAVGSVSYLYANNSSAYTPSGMPISPNSGGGGGGGSGGGIDVGGLMGMFGQSAGVMQDMMKRLHPEGEKAARELHKKVNQDEKFKKKSDINKKTLNKGDPFSVQYLYE